MLKVQKQRRKGFLSNLTKTINRAEMPIENERNISEIALLRENVEFSIFKLRKTLEDIYLYASGTEITKVQQFFNENNEKENKVIIQCERLIGLDDDKQTEITTCAFDVSQGLQRFPKIQVHPPELQMTLTIQKSKGLHATLKC